MYETVHRWLWPDTPSSELGEPARLTEIIDTVIPDDGWLSAGGGDETAVRYIDLHAHFKLLQFSHLNIQQTIHGKKPTFIVRDEYKQFMHHALSLSIPQDPARPALFRCFTCGHPGIGNTVGAHYFLLYLLGLGKSVFWVTDGGVYYFDEHGVQVLRSLSSEPVYRALQQSWVIIDTDQERMPATTYALSPFVIWTSSPHGRRWRYFQKHFRPCTRWYIKPWSTREIAAAAWVAFFLVLPFLWLTDRSDRLGLAHDAVLASMTWHGAVPRYLFQGDPPTHAEVEHTIKAALAGDPFALDTQPDPGPGIFLVTPAAHERRDFSVEFLTPAVAERTFALAADRMDELQPFIAQALERPAMRRAAGKLVEGVMHRALSRGGVRLPEVLGGGGAVAATLELLPDGLVVGGAPLEPERRRPLYLRPSPLRPNFFAPIDAILLSTRPTQLALVQTSLALGGLGAHSSRDFGALLDCIARLPTLGAGVVDEDQLKEVVYCLVGVGAADRVRRLLGAARATLAALKTLSEADGDKFCVEVGVRSDCGVARRRIRMFRVVGLIFDHEKGFQMVYADA